MAFSAADRDITLVFKETGRNSFHERPVYRRAGYNLVSYDGSPDRFVEPVNACLSVDSIGMSFTLMQTPEQAERIIGIEYIRGRMSDVVAFPPDYVDVS